MSTEMGGCNRVMYTNKCTDVEIDDSKILLRKRA